MLPLVFLSLPQGTAAPLLAEVHRALPNQPSYSAALAIADFDGNGTLDLLSTGTQSRLALNDGYGVFADASAGLPAQSATSLSAAAGDVDGDGDADVAIGAYQRLALWSNDGTGSFQDVSATLPVVTLPGGTLASFVELVDVDGDGDLDFFVGTRSGSGPVPEILFRNDGAGVFTDASANLPLSSRNTWSLAFGDVDGDADVDLVLGNDVLDELWLNDGTGRFTDASGQLPPRSNQERSTTALLGDVDGDGDLDLVLVRGINFAGPADEDVWLNDGAGTFTQGPTIPDVADSDDGGTLFEADGDGDLDLFVLANPSCIASASCFDDRLLLNDGAGVFTPSTFAPLAKTTYAAEAADVDDDGDLDLVVASTDDDLYLSDGAGGFLPASSALTPRGTQEFIGIADFDADGTLDAFFPSDDGTNALLLGVPGRGFVDASSNLPPGDPAWSADTGDLDGDADVDLYLAVSGGRNRVLMNFGNGRFEDVVTALPPAEAFTRSVVLADVDGDDDLDALEGNAGSPDLLLRNDGSGRFGPGPSLPASFGGDIALVAADLDLDGDLDFLGSGPNGDHLLLNGGTGVFANGDENLPGSTGWAIQLAVGDIDADGDPDALGAAGFDPERLLLNDGAAVFTSGASNLPPLPGLLFSAALLDVEGDGDLDALVGSVGGGSALLENDGSGLFTSRPELLIPSRDDPRAFGIADVDGDEDLDVLIGNFGSPERHWTNLTRQVARRNVVGVGKRLLIDLRGPSGGTVFLAVAQGTARIPLKFGTLRLDPQTLQGAGTYALDANGVAATTFQIPADPGLVGLTYWMQGLIGPPLRFSNLEELAITAY